LLDEAGAQPAVMIKTTKSAPTHFRMIITAISFLQDITPSARWNSLRMRACHHQGTHRQCSYRGHSQMGGHEVIKSDAYLIKEDSAPWALSNISQSADLAKS